MAAGVVLIMNRDIRNGFIYSILGAMTYGMNPLFALPMYNKGFGAEDDPQRSPPAMAGNTSFPGRRNDFFRQRTSPARITQESR